ncbi:hypothetical protein SteCoe_36149 [Stentor coeruleus]|uniref:Amino acid transporter transmembrane domain-containing protein n=1 Tax=Stentor coeruleus TaxID=5963 RepID=A0A1R2AQR9_9CILI|nr:hypothetical protein SteCoe_36149 [Stentor coeruleus]
MGMSKTRTYFSLIKSMITTGILYQPKSFYLGGLLFSSLCCFGVGFLTLLCMIWLSKAQSKIGGTYSEIAGVAIGKFGLYSVDLMIFITQFGPSAVNFGFVIDNMTSALDIFDTKVNVFLLMLMVLAILLPLCLIKTIREQSIAHIIADLIIIINVAIIGIYSSVTGISDSSISIITPKNMVYTLGTLVYGFEGIALLLPIKSEMKIPQSFDKILSYMIITIIILFIWFSNVCVFAYNNDIKDLVTLNLPKHSWVAVMLILYVFAVILTLPLAMYPTFLITEKYLNLRGNCAQGARVILVIIVAVLGTAARNYLGLLVSVIGGIFCSPLAFIFPAIINLKIMANDKKTRNMSKVMIVIGVIFGISAAFSTLYFNI